MRDGDSRAGLDAEGAAEVAEIMRRERVKCVDRDCGLLWLQENVITDYLSYTIVSIKRDLSDITSIWLGMGLTHQVCII